MNITVNDEQRSVEKEITVFELLELLSLGSTKGVAVAVNDLVVSRTQWEELRLKDNDSVLLITAAQGG